MALSSAFQGMVGITGALLLLACASAPQADPSSEDAGQRGADAQSSLQSRAPTGKSKPPERVDRLLLELDIPGQRPGSAGRAPRFLDITVVIGVDGRPDMSTLRVTGTGTVANRDAIDKWIVNGIYLPGKDALDQAVRSQYKVRVVLGGGGTS